MRTSTDQYREGRLVNGYDYDLQVWVKDGIVQRCGHWSPPCCNGAKYAGMSIERARFVAKIARS